MRLCGRGRFPVVLGVLRLLGFAALPVPDARQSLPALALAVWAGGCLLDYGRQYGNLAVEEGGRFAAEGSVDAVSGRSVLFRPHGARWLYTVSAREGGLPLEPGKRYRIEGEIYSLKPPCGPGLFDRERWGYLHRVAAGVRLERFSELGAGRLAQPISGGFPASP